MRGPSAAANTIHRYLKLDSPPRELGEILQEVITHQEWTQEGETAPELAERWRGKFKASLKRNISDANRDNKFTRYELNWANDDFVQGPCYVEPSDDDRRKEAKRRRANTLLLIDHFEEITPDQFETLCARVLSLFEVEQEYVTRSSADQGIDFYGRIPIGQILKPSVITPGAERQLKIWLVGQAKHYRSTQVSTKDIRELVGSVSLAKSKVYAGSKDPLSNLSMRVCDPVFYLFFTTGKISRDAAELLRRSGVVAMDGEQLSMFLADHGVGINEEYRFSNDLFRHWLFN